MMSLNIKVYSLFLRTYSRSKLLVAKHVLVNKYLRHCYCAVDSVRGKRNTANPFKPQLVKPNTDYVKVGAELVGNLNKTAVTQIIKKFYERPELRNLAEENGLEDYILENTKPSFKKFCSQVEQLPTDLHVVLCDLINGHGHLLDLFPFFYEHATLVYPHLKCKEELIKIGDLTNPANWYPLARGIKRELHFHCGPTNSGKTYSALKKFLDSKKGVYCAPLKLLANEICEKSNENGVPCDLITGEEIRRCLPDDQEANHISCTVEMVSTNEMYDVAVIDEIQMLKDNLRGYAWSRALLGIAAKEIHLCGEESALQYLETIAENLGEKLKVHKYKRLTKLFLENKAVQSFKNIKNGDCIICFSKKDIFSVTSALEDLGIQCAVIYGNLPPGTKIAQAKKFNNPDNKCNVLVATDAVGLGMNLNIKRIVFYSLKKCEESMGEMKKNLITVSQALQIAGRAGRYQSRYPEVRYLMASVLAKGFVTTFKKSDLETLKYLLQSTPEPLCQAGLSPTCEQIELFSYYLPELSLSEVIDILTSMSTLDDSLFFMCDLTNFKRLADEIKHIPLPLKTMHSFCSAPVNYHSSFVMTLFVQFAKKFSQNELITLSFIRKYINCPLTKPANTDDLLHLEEAFDCLDIYLWFGNRFPLSFPDSQSVRALQRELDNVITEGVLDLMKMIKNKPKQNIKEKFEEGEEMKVEDHLIEQGILTPALLDKLKKEWRKELKRDEETNVSDNK